MKEFNWIIGVWRGLIIGGIIVLLFLLYIVFGAVYLDVQDGQKWQRIRVGTQLNIQEYRGYKIEEQTSGYILYGHRDAIAFDVLTDSTGYVIGAGESAYKMFDKLTEGNNK